MILAMDVDYRHDKAVGAAVLLRDWKDDAPIKELIVDCNLVHDYVPGEFYRRELPCLLKLFKQININLDFILIDGYVYLGKDRLPGLGSYLYNALNKRIPVIGVAKSAFKDTPADMALRRGTSQRPLYVSAIGMDQAEARRYIQLMHGPDRIPTLLKRVDRLSREAG